MNNRQKFYEINFRYFLSIPTAFASIGPATGMYKEACIVALVVGILLNVFISIDLLIYKKWLKK